MSLPLRLHTRRIEGRLGGYEWTHDAERYFGHIHQSGAEERHAWLMKHWWCHPACEQELRAFFSRDAVDIVLAIHRDGMDWQHAATHWEHSIAWISYQENKMTAHMRRVIMNASFR